MDLIKNIKDLIIGERSNTDIVSTNTLWILNQTRSLLVIFFLINIAKYAYKSPCCLFWKLIFNIYVQECGGDMPQITKKNSQYIKNSLNQFTHILLKYCKES